MIIKIPAVIKNNPIMLDQMRQLWTVTLDGDLISKGARDRLVRLGLVQRYQDSNWLTQEGVRIVDALRDYHLPSPEDLLAEIIDGLGDPE